MSKKRNAPVEMAVPNKGVMDGAVSSGYDSIVSDLFGQACLRIMKLNEKKGADGYGCYSLSYSDAALSVSYADADEHYAVFHLFRSEINKIGMATALRSLIEILDGEGDAE